LNKVTPTGMKAYLERGRKLLEDSKNGVNPFDKYRPDVPTGIYLTPGEDKFDHYEKEGVKELSKTGFVLIAGGLGERLGYSGIKIGLPVCTIEPNYCYLKYYCHYVLACYDRALPYIKDSDKSSFYVPLCIMTSDDTYS
jgi:UDP-sugar pyrophosphorylase